MFCKNCGKELDDEAVVCPDCGAQLQEPKAEAAPEVAAAEAAPAPAPAPTPAPAYEAAPAPAPVAVQNGKKPVNWYGIVGFVAGLLGLGLGFLYCILPIVGLVFSSIGMGFSKKYSVNGLAIAGLVLSIIATVIWGIIWIAAASVIASLGL